MFGCIRGIAAASLGTLVSVPAFGAPLSVTSEVRVEQRVAAADGTTRVALAATRHVVPGDRLVIALRYRNTGAQPLSDLVLADPVPRGIAYRAPAVGTPEPEVSVDGTHFGPLAAQRVGGRAAAPGDVVTVRWRLTRPLAAGAAGILAFQGVVK